VVAPVKDEESEELELKESAENAESSAEVAADSSLKLATQEDSSSPTTGLQDIF
jgi:hypothetical protein